MFKPARLFFSLLLFTIYSLLFTISPVNAQTNEVVPQNTHNYVQTVMLDTMAAMTCQLTGIDPTGPDPATGETKKCLGYNPQTGELGFVQNGNGAIGAMGGLMAVLYNPPLSSGEYFRYLAGNFGLVKPAYAQQGVGFEGLKPLLAVWTVFRNLVYVLFAVAFILVGLAIMLRVRIDPRTVMTIQNQIPKLIIALLLVTFSYAIAGLLVDVMYVFIYLLFGIVTTISMPGVTPLSEAFRNFQGLNTLEFANNLPVQGPGGVQGILGITLNSAGAVKDVLLGFLFDSPAGRVLGFAIGSALGLGIGQVTGVNQLINAGGATAGAAICTVTGVGVALVPICAGVGGFIANFVQTVIAGGAGAIFSNEILGSIAGIIAFLIIAIAILWSLFRLWFQLIFAYVELLLLVVFAPFWILLGVLPGAPIGFGAWLRTVLSDLSPFPVTIAMFLLAKIFMESFQHVANTTGGKAFMPPLIGNPGDNTYGALASFIGLGFILLTPQVVVMVKDFLKTPVFKYYTAIGQAVGAGTGAPGGIFGRAAGLGSALFGLSNIPGVRNLPLIRSVRAPGGAGGGHGP